MTFTPAPSPALRYAVVASAAALITVWPIPYSMAMRHLVLLIGLIVCATVWWQMKPSLFRRQSWPVWCLIAFFAWLVFHYFFLGTNHEEQLYDLLGDWRRAFLAAFIGLTTGLVLDQTTEPRVQSRLTWILGAGLAGTLVIYLGWYLSYVASTQQFEINFWRFSYLEKPAIAVFGMVFFPFVLLKALNPSQKVVSKLGIAFAGVTLCALAFAFYVSSAKNGFLSLAFALVLFALFVIERSRLAWQIGRMAWVMALLCVVVSVYFAKAHIEANPAWRTMVADVQTSVRIDEHQNWKNRAEHPLPLNSAGTPVNGSTYDRTAWATAGLILIGEHPLGYGLLNHSFGALAKAKWTDFYPPNGKNRGATHSGWIDLTLGIGIPGLLLLWIPLLVSAWRAWHCDRFWHQYVTLTTPIVFFLYLLSEVSTGHFIEFLLFYSALSCGLVWHLPKQNAPDVAL